MPISNGDVTSEGDSLNLKVASPDDGDVYFRIKNTTKLKKLLQAYCDRRPLDRNSVVFTFNGRRLGGDQISQQVGLKDSDVIIAVMTQLPAQVVTAMSRLSM